MHPSAVPAALALCATLGAGVLHPCDIAPTPTHDPVYLSWADLRSAVRSESPRPVARRGKIALKDGLLLLSEPNRGVHVFDNADPADPRPLAFLNIPGNIDIAVKGAVLYADSFTDLLALDIGSLPEVRVLSRQVDVFPWDPYQAADTQVYGDGSELRREKGVVVAWVPKGGRK